MKVWFDRLMTFCYFVLPLPLILACYQVVASLNHLDDLHRQAERIHVKGMQTEATRQKEQALLAPLTSFNPHYLDQHVETMGFLLPEVKKMEGLLVGQPDNEALFRQLQKLTSNQNRLRFSEGKIATHDLFREVEEVQQHPIEMNEEDLKRLLSLIEGGTIWPYGPKEGRPLFVITDFKLSKKELISKEKVYVVSMKLLKREGI